MPYVTWRSNNPISIYVDEAGGTRPQGPFVAGFWATWRPKLWQTRVRALKEKHNATGELHFHKIAGRRDDRRFLTAAELLQLMATDRPPTWFARFIYVSQDYLSLWKKQAAINVYDFMMTQLMTRFCRHLFNPIAHITMDERHRPTWDDYIPQGLEQRLNELGCDVEYRVQTESSKESDLLQVADLVCSAVRQIHVPSENPCKQYLAGMVAGQIGQRVKVWDWPHNSATERERAPS